MSADSITVCPACYAKEHNRPITEITGEDLNDESITNELREYYEFYFDCGEAIVRYDAHCRECGYLISFEYKHPLPEPK